MGWYNKRLQVDPSLVAMTGGLGKGAKAFGDSLVSLGDQKIAQAKENAAEKEKQAKIKAQAQYNKAINPIIAQKIGEEGLGLIALQAPVDTSKIVSEGSTLVKDGKAIYTAPKEEKGFTIKKGETRYDASGKPIVSLPTDPKAPTQRTVNIGGKNVVQEYVDGKWITSADAPVYNQSAAAKKTEGLVTTGGLSGAQIMYARDNNLTTKVDGKEYVTKEVLKQLQEMDKVGNQEVN